MAYLSYTNSTFNNILGLIPDPKVRESFDEWNERKKNKLAPYTVKLNDKVVKAFGDIESVDGQKSITYETTYGDILSLKGKRRPKTVILDFLIEYDIVNDNEAQMREEVSQIERAKKDRTPVNYSVTELNIDYKVTIETLTIRYRGARDIYIRAELMEVVKNENSN